MKKLAVLTILIVAILLPLVSNACANEPVIHMTANQLLTAYEQDELAIDAVVKDKTIAVTGEIASKGRNNLGTAYVMLWAEYNGPEEHPNGAPYISFLEMVNVNIECRFSEHAADLATVSSGNTVRIKGTCLGLSRSILGDYGNIIIDDCRIVG